MQPGKKQRIVLITTFIILACCASGWYVRNNLYAGYYNDKAQKVLKQRSSDRMQNAENLVAMDSCIGLLHSGDLVMRTGADVISYMLCQMNQENKTYSHCGLVMVENGYPFVYHSIGGEDNPDEVLRRDSAKFFLSPANNLGFGIARYDADSQHIDKLHKVVDRFYKEKHKFDLQFDLATNDRLYCAEFVYKAMNEAMKDAKYIQPITRNGFRFVGVDNLFCNSHAKVVCQVEYK